MASDWGDIRGGGSSISFVGGRSNRVSLLCCAVASDEPLRPCGHEIAFAAHDRSLSERHEGMSYDRLIQIILKYAS